MWAAYTAQRRQLVGALAAKSYSRPCDIRPLATEGDFLFPLEGAGSLEAAAGEVFLFYGPSDQTASIRHRGFDVRDTSTGATCEQGIYFAESAAQAEQHLGQNGTAPLTMVVARVLLGRSVKVTAPRKKALLLSQVQGKNTYDTDSAATAAAAAQYDNSLVSDVRM